MASEVPKFDPAGNQYSIDADGNWIAAPKTAAVPGKWESAGATDKLLSQLDARIIELTAKQFGKNPAEESTVHIKHLTTLKKHVLGKIDNYYTPSETGAFGWFWKGIHSIVSYFAASKFDKRLGQLEQLEQLGGPYYLSHLSSKAQAPAQPLSPQTAQTSQAAQSSAATSSAPLEGEIHEKWLNFKEEVRSKQAAVEFMSQNKENNFILWSDSPNQYCLTLRTSKGCIHTESVTFENKKGALDGRVIIICRFKFSGLENQYFAQSSTAEDLQSQILRKTATIRGE